MYLHEHGAQWEDETCIEAAAQCDTLNFAAFMCLKYAHKYGAPWNETVKIIVIFYLHIDLLYI